jgi:glycosyltransferase involved in cell wall biosynthesis
VFTVVVPAYNHERFLTQCLESAARSPLVDEVLVADDASRDGSRELIRRLTIPKVRDLTPDPPVNEGAHGKLNRLVRAASSEWLAVLNSDDYYLAGRFELLAAAIRLNPADLLFGDLLLVDESGEVRGEKRGPFIPEYAFPDGMDVAKFAQQEKWLDLLANQNFIATTSNMVFRRSLFDRIGGFAPFRYVHDWDFALRACLVGTVRYVPQFLTAYRLHPSNTIKEDGSRVDAEVRDLFSKLDLPDQRLALEGNRHLQSTPHCPLTLVVPASEQAYIDAVRERIAGVELEPKSGAYIYAPAKPTLTPEQLQNAVLGCAFVDHESIAIGGDGPDRTVRRVRVGGRPFPNTLLPARRFPDAPVVFVFPALFAMGGVERQIVDMLQHLHGRYEFVVISTERLAPELGSFRPAAGDLALAFYDLSELAPYDLYLPMIERLRDTYKPSLVLVSNGSNWLSDAAMELRNLFRDIPIVDNRCYDDNEGWIRRMHEPGSLTADRYIAVNQRIRRAFIDRLGIAETKIDLIYSPVDSSLLGPIDRPEPEKDALASKHGIQRSRPLFGWVARLGPQKRPLDFLELARRLPEHQFVMAGDGPMAAECDAFIARHAIANVKRLGFVPQVWEVLCLFDGFLVTSAFEGLPITMLCALSLGVPAISTDVGDVGLVLEQHGVGTLFDNIGDPDRSAAQLRDFAARLPHLGPAARAAAPRIREQFSAGRCAREYDECFRRASRKPV